MRGIRSIVWSCALIAAIGACGGTESVAPPPPPPPPPAAAATVSVLAGDGQTVAAGEDAPVAPAVVVRDASGNPFPGAAVQFSVAAGGGTLEGAAQTTDASGVARVVRWTVGPSGVQRVSATVGSLPPASIEASIAPGTEIMVDVVPVGGGEVAITAPGHPYQGLTLTIPPGTFPAPVNWSLRVRPGATPPALPSGYRAAGPLLEIATDAPRGTALMTLDVPVRRQSGEAVVIVFIDPVRGAMEVMPTVGISATSIRVATTHLRADLLRGRRSAGSAVRLAAPPIGSTIGSMMPVLVTLPQPPVNPVINPNTQSWPVLDNGSAELPDGFGSTIPAMTVLGTLSGMSAHIVKGLSTPGTYADGGILGAVEAAAQNPGITTAQLNALLGQFGPMPKADRDELTSQVMTAELAITGNPGLAALFKSSQGPTDDETWFTNTIASSNNELTTKEPTKPGTGVLSQVAAGFSGLTVQSTNDGPATVADGALPMSSFVFDFEKAGPYVDLIMQYENLTPAQRIALNEQLIKTFKTKTDYELETIPGGGYSKDTDPTLAVRSDQLTIRVAGGTVKFSLHDLFGPEVDRSGGPGIDLSNHVGPTNGQKNSLIVSTFQELGNKIRQMLPENIEVARARFSASPDSVRVATDSTAVMFQADVPLPPSGGFRVRWDWGDGQTSENLSLTAGNHTYAASGDYTVTATLLSADGTRVLAIDTVRVKGDAVPNWVITSITNPDTLQSTPLVPLSEILVNATTSPGTAMISLASGLGVSELSLRGLPGGWNATNCCGNGPALPGELRGRLGLSPAFTTTYGKYFVDRGYGATRFSQSTTDLSAGTMSAEASLGTYTYNIRVPLGGPDRQPGPEIVMRMDGIRNGKVMTGTITLTYFSIEDPTGNDPTFYIDGPETFRFPFTAMRIR